MTESFLHYIWQYGLFSKADLRTVDDQQVEVLKPGKYNTGSGPDFFNAQIKLGDTVWAGNVEIHIRSSDWQRHNHQTDLAYDTCILHVVFENDAMTFRTNGTPIPAIVLKDKFPSYLWENYLRLIGTGGWISCQQRLNEIDNRTWQVTIERLIKERLDQRTQQVFISVDGNKGDWEECFYQHLARNFGFQLNALPFEMLARSLPLKYIKKERSRLIHIEAMLYGQAGMLLKKTDEGYTQELLEIYSHLSNKYSLNNISFSSWRFLRLRPVNFPAVRIAQLASLLSGNETLFSRITNTSSLNEISSLFKVEASEYWNTHYHFKKTSEFKIKKLGSESINNLLINTCIPFLYAWGKYSGSKEQVERALHFIAQIPPEENHLIRKWKNIGVKANSALETQSLLQLKILHCAEKKCLACAIGSRLINILP